MKYNILIPDLLTNTVLEKKILGKKYKITLTNPKSFKKLNDKFFEKVDGVMVGHHVPLTKNIIKKLKNCKIIVRYGVGFDSVDINQASLQGIRVFNIPDYGVDEVADHALGLILNLSRFLSGNDEILKEKLRVKKTLWKYDLNKKQKRLKKLNLGIIGLGRIGMALGYRSKSIFENIMFYDPFLEDGYDKSLGFKRVESLDEIFKRSDVISVHVPSSSKNKFFLHDKYFNKIKKNIIFINTSRGDLVKDDTLAKFYLKQKILAMGLDVFQKEPISHNSKLSKLWLNKKNTGRIIFTPHVAFYSQEALFEIRYKGVNTLKKYFQKKVTKNCINLQLIK
jgi:lactate dehydrogenase-like 2-hydroxyacid dehydrogenase